MTMAMALEPFSEATRGKLWHASYPNGQFVVDDVRIFDRFPAEGPSRLLSDSFAGCAHSHWTGQAAENK